MDKLMDGRYKLDDSWVKESLHAEEITCAKMLDKRHVFYIEKWGTGVWGRGRPATIWEKPCATTLLRLLSRSP